MKKRHFTKLSAFALAAALSVITAAVPFGDAFPITTSITASAEPLGWLETLKIRGVSVVEYGITGSTTSGSNWNYDPTSNTLYINGENSYDDTLGGRGAYIYVDGDLTIKVTGNSKITSVTDSVGIYSESGEVTLIIDECFSLTFSLCEGSMSNGCRGAIAADKWIGIGGSVKMNGKEIECEKYKATFGGHTCENGKCTKCGAFEITEENFPDEKFRTYLKTFDTDKDGLLSADELEKVTKINVNSKEISDLKGIELFTALEELDCGSNSLTTLDLSKNINLEKLDCDSNQLTSLNLANNTKLREVDCCGNSITELDVSKHINLTELNCSSNNLPSLDVSKNINLKNLNCSSDSLMSLDVSKNINLTELNCSSNNLPSLDTGDNSDITSIDCSLNYLTQLDVSSFKKLSKLDCYSNQLTELDVTGCGSLTDLDCSSNKLTELDVKNNTELTELDCSYNSISSLNLNNNANLTKLRCTSCELESLDLSGNQLLEDLYCEYNNMISLNFANNASLVNLWCGYNNLEELDLSNCEQLVSLRCYDNMLKKIDANSCTKLENFYCNNNQLNSLDLSNCNIKTLWLKNNPIAAINCSNDLSSRSNRLDFCPVSENESTFDITKYGGDPTRIGTVTGGELVNNIIKPNEGTDKVTYEYKYNSNSESVINCTVYFSEEGKELIYINKENFPDDYFRDYVINSLKDASNKYVGEDGVLTADEIAEVKEISVSYRSISDLKGIEYFTALTELDCSDNALTKLDVSKNVNLTKLDCSYNRLTKLDLSNNTALTSLYCYSNNLTSLDVSKSTNLTRLYCSDNQLTLLDLSKNTALTELECSDNQMTSLDLSKNINLTQLDCSYNPLTSLDLKATAVTDLSANTTFGEYAYKAVFDGGKLDLTTLRTCSHRRLSNKCK